MKQKLHVKLSTQCTVWNHLREAHKQLNELFTTQIILDGLEQAVPREDAMHLGHLVHRVALQALEFAVACHDVVVEQLVEQGDVVEQLQRLVQDLEVAEIDGVRDHLIEFFLVGDEFSGDFQQIWKSVALLEALVVFATRPVELLQNVADLFIARWVRTAVEWKLTALAPVHLHLLVLNLHQGIRDIVQSLFVINLEDNFRLKVVEEHFCDNFPRLVTLIVGVLHEKQLQLVKDLNYS